LSRSRTVIVIMALLLSSYTQAGSKQPDIKKEVMASFQSLVDASKTLDAELYFQHFELDKFVGLNSDGTNWNSIDELASLINTGFDSIEEVVSLEFPNINISVIDNYTAVLVNEYSQTVLLKDGRTITFSGGGAQVWTKRSGKWKLVSVSASHKPNISTP